MSRQPEFGVIGKPRRRVDGRAKATGAKQYADDIVRPRMLHAKILRSPHPHARILDIDTTAAAHAPGVHLVLTRTDFPVTFGTFPVSMDEHPLARDRVRYIGDPVAAVIATDEATAAEALDLIDVGYEVFPTIGSVQEALATPEPRIHDYGYGGNIHRNHAFEFGDVDEAMARADHVFEDLFFYEGNTHLPIEQHASVADVDGEGKLMLWSSTQTPHYVHRQLARALEMPAKHIRVISCPQGGGFGGKSDVGNHEVLVAKAALVLGRAVKICLTREEVFYMHRGRHPVLMRLRTGTTADGQITGMHLQTLLDGGGYGSFGAASTLYTGSLQPTTYRIPRYRFEAVRTFTNKPPCGPKRGHGTPQPRFAQEVQLDKIAERLGKDPADLRLGMLAEPHSVTVNWLRLGSIGLGECIETVVQRSGWRGKHRQLPPGHGVGLACGSYMSGAGRPIYNNDMPHSGVQILLDRSGQVTAFCGAAEVGQGSDDVLAGIVAEVLGVDPFDVRVVTGDTAITPIDLGSYSSRVTMMMGNAAITAAERIRAQLTGAVAEHLGCDAADLGCARGRVARRDDRSVGVSFQEAIVLAESRTGTVGAVGSYTPAPSPGQYQGAGVGPSPAYSYSASVVQVEVDPTTGWVTVEKVWIAHDIGRALNPTLALGQVEGSVYMALGEALMEEQVFRRLRPKLSHALVHKSPSMLEYKSLTALDMPAVDTVLVEHPDPNGPFGAKEVGQGPLLPIMPAVANAVYDAVGVRIDVVPITPEKVLRALDAKAKGEPARYGPTSFPDVPYRPGIFVLPPWEGGDGRESPRPATAGAAQGLDPLVVSS